jgi:hypothetical protein
VGVRDFANQRGVDLSAYGDDEAALNYLMSVAQRAQQADVYTQLGRQLAPQAQQIQQYLQQQQQPAPQPDYLPPSMDDRWLSMVEQDPATGLVFGKPGTPPQIVDAVNKRIAWQRDFNNNPAQFFDRHMQAQMPNLVNQMVNQRLAQFSQQQAIDSILHANAEWLYQRDQSGNMLQGPQGYVPTPHGQRYIQYVSTLQRSGILDPRVQDELARRLTFGEIAMGQAMQANAPPAQQQRQATAMPNRNVPQVNQALSRAAQPGATEVVPEGLSLYEYMKKEMDAAGITDQDFILEAG